MLDIFLFLFLLLLQFFSKEYCSQLLIHYFQQLWVACIHINIFLTATNLKTKSFEIRLNCDSAFKLMKCSRIYAILYRLTSIIWHYSAVLFFSYCFLSVAFAMTTDINRGPYFSSNVTALLLLNRFILVFTFVLMLSDSLIRPTFACSNSNM